MESAVQGHRDIALLTLEQWMDYAACKKVATPMQAYCMKCRTKREMKDAKSITMKNGKPATQGVCPTCGTKMFRIGSK
jgi:Zn finger protein HypA/HybF involved in hydrogenase expression